MDQFLRVRHARKIRFRHRQADTQGVVRRFSLAMPLRIPQDIQTSLYVRSLVACVEARQERLGHIDMPNHETDFRDLQALHFAGLAVSLKTYPLRDAKLPLQFVLQTVETSRESF